MFEGAAWPPQASIFLLAEPLIVRFEGFRAKPYLCSAGKATIGYGTTRYPNGWPVGLLDKPCTEAEARTYLEYSMGRVLAGLQTPGIITRSPTVHQAAALVSLAYNIGVGAHDGKKGDLADSTLLARFNAGSVVAAADQFLVWNKEHVAVKVVASTGLSTRRRIERDVFLTADAPINHLTV